jgi:flagellar biosynthesis protein FlhG
MKDQAEKLRKIIDSSKLVNTIEVENIEFGENTFQSKNARVITITSGKGGVGKTNFTVNLALSLIEAGLRVVVLDADFGLANIEVVLGTIPKYTLLDVIKNKKNLLEVISSGPSNIRFISGGSGVEELARLSIESLNNFIKNINLLDRLFDVILVDTGAGVSENVLSMILAADDVIVVTTPEPTSITDAYALIKMISQRDSKKNLKVLINRAENETEAVQVFTKLKEVTGKFIGVELSSFGYLNQDETVKKAVRIQKPFLLSFPKSHISKQIREISKNIGLEKNVELNNQNLGVKNFIKKFVKFMSS